MKFNQLVNSILNENANFAKDMSAINTMLSGGVADSNTLNILKQIYQSSAGGYDTANIGISSKLADKARQVMAKYDPKLIQQYFSNPSQFGHVDTNKIDTQQYLPGSVQDLNENKGPHGPKPSIYTTPLNRVAAGSARQQQYLLKLAQDVQNNPEVIKQWQEMGYTPEQVMQMMQSGIDQTQEIANDSQYDTTIQKQLNSLDPNMVQQAYKQTGVDINAAARGNGYAKKQAANVARQNIPAVLGQVQEKKMKNTCWKGYKPIGTKKKNGKTVPNCVPIKEAARCTKVTGKASSDRKDKKWMKCVKSGSGYKRIHWGQKGVRVTGKLQAKLEQRAKLSKISYNELDDSEKEKDRVVARAILNALSN